MEGDDVDGGAVHESIDTEAAVQPESVPQNPQTPRTAESKPETVKKSQESKRQSTVGKEPQGQGVPDLEAEEVFRDFAVLSVSMLTAVAAATLHNRPLYEHLCMNAREKV